MATKKEDYNIAGIRRNIPSAVAPDISAAEIINLRNEDGVWRAEGINKQAGFLYDTRVENAVASFIHNSTTHGDFFVFAIEDGLYYCPKEPNGIITKFYTSSVPISDVLFSNSNDVLIANLKYSDQLNNIIKYFTIKTGSYRELPTLKNNVFDFVNIYTDEDGTFSNVKVPDDYAPPAGTTDSYTEHAYTWCLLMSAYKTVNNKWIFPSPISRISWNMTPGVWARPIWMSNGSTLKQAYKDAIPEGWEDYIVGISIFQAHSDGSGMFGVSLGANNLSSLTFREIDVFNENRKTEFKGGLVPADGIVPRPMTENPLGFWLFTRKATSINSYPILELENYSKTLCDASTILTYNGKTFYGNVKYDVRKIDGSWNGSECPIIRDELNPFIRVSAVWESLYIVKHKDGSFTKHQQTFAEYLTRTPVACVVRYPEIITIWDNTAIEATLYVHNVSSDRYYSVKNFNLVPNNIHNFAVQLPETRMTINTTSWYNAETNTFPVNHPKWSSMKRVADGGSSVSPLSFHWPYSSIEMTEHTLFLFGTTEFENGIRLYRINNEGIIEIIYDGNIAKTIPPSTPPATIDIKGVFQERSNVVVASELYIPMVAKDFITVGNEKVEQLAVNTRSLDASNFGLHPILAFTTSGIYALEVGAETAVVKVAPMATDIIIPDTRAINIGEHVAFISEDGIRLATSSITALISAPLDNFVQNNLIKNNAYRDLLHKYGLTTQQWTDQEWDISETPISSVDFRTFCNGAKLFFNNNRKELMVWNRQYKYAYIYNMSKKYWRKTIHKYNHVISSDAELFGVSREEDDTIFIYDLDKYVSADANANEQHTIIFAQTNPIKLGLDSFERIYRLIPRIKITSADDEHACGAFLFASNDAEKWKYISGMETKKPSNNFAILRGASSFKYHVVIVAGKFNTFYDYLSSMSIEYESRYANKIRQ